MSKSMIWSLRQGWTPCSLQLASHVRGGLRSPGRAIRTRIQNALVVWISSILAPTCTYGIVSAMAKVQHHVTQSCWNASTFS